MTSTSIVHEDSSYQSENVTEGAVNTLH